VANHKFIHLEIILVLLLSSCASGPLPYPTERIAHLNGITSAELVKFLGEPSRITEIDENRVFFYDASYAGAAAVVQSRNCQFIFVVNPGGIVSSVDMSGNAGVCSDFLHANKKQFRIK